MVDVTVVLILDSDDDVSFFYHGVKSIWRSIQYAKAYNISCDLLVVSNLSKSNVEVGINRCGFNEYDFYELPSSNQFEKRNFGALKANGKYVTFLDGRDLMSKNWISEAFSTLENLECSAIVHPEYEVLFDGVLRIIKNDDSNDLMDYAFLSGNAYSENCFVARDVLLKFSYDTVIEEFKDNYWDFNGVLINNSIKHLCATKSIYFIRRLREKDLHLSKSEYDMYFTRISLSKKKFLSQQAFPIDKIHIKKKCFLIDSFVSVLLHPIQTLGKRTRDVLFLCRVNKRFFYKRFNAYRHKWFCEELIEINSIEPVIQSQRYKHNFLTYNRTFIECNAVLSNEILQFFCKLKKAEVYGFVPFFGLGGAENVARIYLQILEEKYHGNVVTYATDIKSDTKLLSKTKIVLNSECNRCFFSTRIVAQLLIYFKPRIIYFNNSGFFYNLLSEYGLVLEKFAKIYCSAFALSYSKNTNELSWLLVEYIKKIYSSITRLITDNKNVINQLIDIFNMNEMRFLCNYTPIQLHDFIPKFRDGILNIFWASRICREKRLDVLLKIVDGCSGLPVVFHIFGAPNFRYSDTSLNRLRRCSNVRCYGKYSGFSSIVNENFDAFLYTSESDGVPNVILEAMSYGYSVIAPMIGGIPEVVNKENGFLVNNYEDYLEYIEIIKSLIQDKSVLKYKQKAIEATLETYFRHDTFVENMQKIGMIE